MNKISANRLIIALSILLIAAVIIILVGYFYTRPNKEPIGRILLRIPSDHSSLQYEMLIMDGNGNYIQWLGEISGSPTWSPSGAKIAVGCPSDDETAREICILDARQFQDIRSFPQRRYDPRPEILTRIELPKQCQKIEYKQPDNYHWGILSLSWSPDEKKLVVVCGDEALDGQRDVCVVPIAGNASCWDKSISKNVYRAVWSPSEDVIVIGDRGDDSSKIYLLNPNGTDAVYLTDGWSPEWSPDGKQIAYIRWDVMQTEITPHQIGIATVDSNGKNMRWLYLSEPSSDFTGVIFLNFCDVLSGTCRLTWSPDGRYIAFVASTIEAYAYRLFRLEVKTGEISILLDPAIYGHLMSEPDWGP